MKYSKSRSQSKKIFIKSTVCSRVEWWQDRALQKLLFRNSVLWRRFSVVPSKRGTGTLVLFWQSWRQRLIWEQTIRRRQLCLLREELSERKTHSLWEGKKYGVSLHAERKPLWLCVGNMGGRRHCGRDCHQLTKIWFFLLFRDVWLDHLPSLPRNGVWPWEFQPEQCEQKWHSILPP